MEKSRLRPELQIIIDQFARFRNEYSSLKEHCAAQEELINLQKLELEQMRFSVEQLASTLVEYQNRFNTTLSQLETENRRLQKNIDNLNRESESTQINRNNDEYSYRLEEQLAELRSKIATQEEKYDENIEAIETRHREEISSYKMKVEQMISMQRRHSEEISAYEMKLEQINSSEKRHSEEIAAYKKKFEQMNSLQTRRIKIDDANNTVQESNAQNKRNATHPALNEDTRNKRKKFTPASSKWPQLGISVKKKLAEAQTEGPKRKKRSLYQADDEEIVDLEC